jgi:carboxyl-terminal processing protease
VISLDDAHAYASIDRMLPGSPAERGGLKRGDRITAIDGRSVRDLGNASGVRDALRGNIGTSVALTYERPMGAAPSVPGRAIIVRAAVHDPEVTTARFGDTGYLALSRFGDRAGAELTAALRDFKADGVRAIVLDLRANGGGYGDEATAVASAFVTGPVFTTRERGGTVAVATASGTPVWTGPLAVLVDGDTASAAEIVAGALQDDGAGTIVGVRTFGKGVVQSVFPLPDGSAVKLTTARYTTPKGRDIDKVGITPDVSVGQPPGLTIGDPQEDAQLDSALAILGRDRPSPAGKSSASPPAKAPSSAP